MSKHKGIRCCFILSSSHPALLLLPRGAAGQTEESQKITTWAHFSFDTWAPKPRKARTAWVSLALGVCLICLLLSTNPRATRRLQQPQQRAVRGRVLWEGRRVKECCRRSKRGHRWPDNRECSGLWFAGLFLMELVCWPQNWAVSCSMSILYSNTLSLPQGFLNPAAWRTVRPDQWLPLLWRKWQSLGDTYISILHYSVLFFKVSIFL